MNKKIVIATHSFSPGTSQAFHTYCLRKGYDVLFIEHPLFGNIFTWLWGTIDTFAKVMFTKSRYDLFVGSNRLNTVVGTLLKAVGKVKKVIYFSPDWSEKRFNNSIFNFIFQKLDYICVKYADIVWNSSHVMKIDPMMREREKLGYPIEWRKKQIQVSDGCDLLPIVPFSQINRYQIGFVGHLMTRCGIDLLIDTFPDIKKAVSDASALIIGSGDLEQEYRNKTKHLNIKFAGFIGDINKVYKLLSHCAVAIAPYQLDTISQYTDPGKVKNYFSVGLPVIITKVPQIAYEIQKERCGIAINYSKKEFTKAIIKLLTNDTILQQYRKKVLKLRKKYSWDTIFNRALSKINLE